MYVRTRIKRKKPSRLIILILFYSAIHNPILRKYSRMHFPPLIDLECFSCFAFTNIKR